MSIRNIALLLDLPDWRGMRYPALSFSRRKCLHSRVSGLKVQVPYKYQKHQYMDWTILRNNHEGFPTLCQVETYNNQVSEIYTVQLPETSDLPGRVVCLSGVPELPRFTRR